MRFQIGLFALMSHQQAATVSGHFQKILQIIAELLWANEVNRLGYFVYEIIIFTVVTVVIIRLFKTPSWSRKFGT